jgi:hypothetical protein
MKFTDPIAFEPKKAAPKSSWWAHPDVQSDRGRFTAWALAEQSRIVGNPKFGSDKRTHDRFSQSKKRK